MLQMITRMGFFAEYRIIDVYFWDTVYIVTLWLVLKINSNACDDTFENARLEGDVVHSLRNVRA